METPETQRRMGEEPRRGLRIARRSAKTLRADLETYAEADADARLRNNAIAKLIEDNPFEVPNTLIETRPRNLLEQFRPRPAAARRRSEKVEKSFVQMAYRQMRQQAERDVRGAMLLERIGETREGRGRR